MNREVPQKIINGWKIALKIRNLKKTNPDMTAKEIGYRYGVHQSTAQRALSHEVIIPEWFIAEHNKGAKK